MSPLAPSLDLGAAPCRILGAGTAFPSGGVDSATLLDALAPGLPPRRRAALLSFVVEELGVGHRAHVSGSERAWSLAVEAAERALDQAERPSIVAHVHATSTPSRWTGADAARIGRALGLRSAHLDLRGGCTGGLWGLVQAARLCRDSGGAVLLTAADALSLTFPSEQEGGERLLPLAMGDGAAALVIAPAERGGLVRAIFGGEPSLCDLSTVPRELPSGTQPMSLAGDPQVFSDATRQGLRVALEALAPPPEAIVALHARADVARSLTSEPWLATLAAHGMLGVASLPTALVELRERGRSGLIGLATAGGGLGFGAALWEES